MWSINVMDNGEIEAGHGQRVVLFCGYVGLGGCYSGFSLGESMGHA